VLFDGGIKKLPRAHQYFCVKRAQERVAAYKGGIIWHTQGSGKSIVMVMLAKWILENKAHARVLILTDRDELDKQIERVFSDSGEAIYRTSSGHDLMAQLGQAAPRAVERLTRLFEQVRYGNYAPRRRDQMEAVDSLQAIVNACEQLRMERRQQA
jgi:type I restriction enzyme R subunit